MSAESGTSIFFLGSLKKHVGAGPARSFSEKGM